MLVVSLISILGASLSFYDKKIGMGIFFICTLLVGLFGIPLFYKKMIKQTVNKNMTTPTWDIVVELNDDSIYYTFATEDKSNIDPYIWGDISNVIEKPKYYYIQIDTRTILLIKKADVDNLEELETLFKTKLTTRFFPLKK